MEEKYTYLKTKSKNDEVDVDMLHKNLCSVNNKLYIRDIAKLIWEGKKSENYEEYEKQNDHGKIKYDLEKMDITMQRVLQKYFYILKENL